MAPRPHENLERYLLSRYQSAHALLTTDAARAESMFAELLEEPRLALWMRTQCNLNLAFLADDPDAADHYLRDARHVLGLFKENRTPPDPDPMQPEIVAMEQAFEDAEKHIQHRRDHPDDEDDDEEGEDEDEGASNVEGEGAAEGDAKGDAKEGV